MVEILIALILFGFVLWLVTTLIPLDPTIRKVIIGVACLLLCLWLLDALGLWHGGGIRPLWR